MDELLYDGCVPQLLHSFQGGIHLLLVLHLGDTYGTALTRRLDDGRETAFGPRPRHGDAVPAHDLVRPLLGRRDVIRLQVEKERPAEIFLHGVECHQGIHLLQRRYDGVTVGEYLLRFFRLLDHIDGHGAVGEGARRGVLSPVQDDGLITCLPGQVGRLNTLQGTSNNTQFQSTPSSRSFLFLLSLFLSSVSPCRDLCKLQLIFAPLR